MIGLARPYKVGLDYFPLDCHMDDKVRLVEAEFGIKGFAIVIKLYQRIYGIEGYYITWNDDVKLLFAREIGVGDNLVSEVVNRCIERDIFNQSLYEQYGILSSYGIQSRYYEVANRRSPRKLVKQYILFSALKNMDTDSNNQDIVDNNGVNDNKNEQSKVNKSIYIMIDEFEEFKGKPINTYEADLITCICENYDHELIKYAISRALENHAHSIGYVERILMNWAEQNITTIGQAQQAVSKQKYKKNAKNAGKLKVEDWDNDEK